ncbi:MAG: hypothetical protein M3159_07675 [Actinomycetota bacterium]|nr:hypothetical protein [Actinomycetota bacterium]
MSSANDEPLAVANNFDSAPGSASTASEITEACSGDSSPWRAAAAVLGWRFSRLAVLMAAAAAPTDVPVLRARALAADESPPERHNDVCAPRAAARALTVAAIFSMAEACSTTSPASQAEINAGSKPAA